MEQQKNRSNKTIVEQLQICGLNSYPLIRESIPKLVAVVVDV